MVRYIIHNHFYRPTRDEASFKEGEHPRVSNGPKAGQFAPKGGGGGGGAPSAEAKAKNIKEHGLNPYFADKYWPSESPSHFVKQFNAVSKLKNASGYFRNVCSMLKKDVQRFHKDGSVDTHTAAQYNELLNNKIAESLQIQKDNLLKKGEADKALKIAVAQINTGLSAPKPAPPPAAKPNVPPPLPANITQSDLEKAKSTMALSPHIFGYQSSAISALVNKFNDKYQGQPLTEQSQLVEKVQAFQNIKDFAQKEQAEAGKAHEQGLKEVMGTLHATEAQAKVFMSLAKMVGESKNPEQMLTQFKNFEKEAKDYGYPMSGFEAALVKSYSDGTYGGVNNALRGGSWSEETHAYTKVLNSALDKMPKYKGTVYRGAPLSPEQQKVYKVGHIVEERGFTSTSTNGSHSQTTKGNTRYVITATGKRAANIKKLSYHTSEDEILFKARTFFKVTKVDGQPGSKMTVHMEEWEE